LRFQVRWNQYLKGVWGCKLRFFTIDDFARTSADYVPDKSDGDDDGDDGDDDDGDDDGDDDDGGDDDGENVYDQTLNSPAQFQIHYLRRFVPGAFSVLIHTHRNRHHRTTIVGTPLIFYQNTALNPYVKNAPVPAEHFRWPSTPGHLSPPRDRDAAAGWRKVSGGSSSSRVSDVVMISRHHHNHHHHHHHHHHLRELPALTRTHSA
jgi:hypothetical protein